MLIFQISSKNNFASVDSNLDICESKYTIYDHPNYVSMTVIFVLCDMGQHL